MMTKEFDISKLHARYEGKFWDIHFINVVNNHITISRPLEGLLNLKLDNPELELKVEV
jgi:hypothetical protein